MQKCNKEPGCSMHQKEHQRPSQFDESPAITPKCPDITSTGRLSGTLTEHVWDKLQRVIHLLMFPRDQLIQRAKSSAWWKLRREGTLLHIHRPARIPSLCSRASFALSCDFEDGQEVVCIHGYVRMHIFVLEKRFLSHSITQVCKYWTQNALLLVKTATTWQQRRELVHCCSLP